MKVCLTLNRTDQAKKEFKRVGLNDVEMFKALPSIGPHQSFNLSTKSILQAFADSTANTLLFMEDDVQFLDLRPLADLLDDLKLNPVPFDIIYLGCNVQDNKPQMIRRNLYRIRNAWTTHAVVYTKRAAQVLLSNFPNESEVMYDNYLGNMLGVLRAFVIKPMVAVQRPGYSDIWKANVDYRNIFQESENKLK